MPRERESEMKPSSFLVASVSASGQGQDTFQITLSPKTKTNCVGIKFFGSTLSTASLDGQISTSVTLQIASHYQSELIAVGAVLTDGRIIPLLLSATVETERNSDKRKATVELSRQYLATANFMIDVSEDGIAIRRYDHSRYSSYLHPQATCVPSGSLLLQFVFGKVALNDVQSAARPANNNSAPKRPYRLDVHKRVR